MTQKPIEWARQYAATMDDATSLRHMHRFAEQNIAEDETTMQMLNDGTEDLGWLRASIAENKEAQRLIMRRLKELGLDL